MSTWLEVKQWSDEQTLHPVPKSVLHELVSYFGQDGAVHPTQKRIAQSTGWSERTVRNCLVYLAENGYIERVRKYNGHAFKVMTSYEFCIEQAMIIPLYTWSEAQQPAAPAARTNRHDVPVATDQPAAHDRPTGSLVPVMDRINTSASVLEKTDESEQKTDGPSGGPGEKPGQGISGFALANSDEDWDEDDSWDDLPLDPVFAKVSGQPSVVLTPGVAS